MFPVIGERHGRRMILLVLVVGRGMIWRFLEMAGACCVRRGSRVFMFLVMGVRRGHRAGRTPLGWARPVRRMECGWWLPRILD